jgi:hypothetical protein
LTRKKPMPSAPRRRPSWIRCGAPAPASARESGSLCRRNAALPTLRAHSPPLTLACTGEGRFQSGQGARATNDACLLRRCAALLLLLHASASKRENFHVASPFAGVWGSPSPMLMITRRVAYVCCVGASACFVYMHAESAAIGEVASQRNGEEAGKAVSKDGSKVKVEAGAANSAQLSSHPPPSPHPTPQHQQVCGRERARTLCKVVKGARGCAYLMRARARTHARTHTHTHAHTHTANLKGRGGGIAAGQATGAGAHWLAGSWQ